MSSHSRFTISTVFEVRIATASADPAMNDVMVNIAVFIESLSVDIMMCCGSSTRGQVPKGAKHICLGRDTQLSLRLTQLACQ